MATSQSQFGRRLDEEFKREVAALAREPGATNEQVGRDLGMSAWSVSRWKRQYGGAGETQSPPPDAAAPGVNVQELARRIKALERENADLREPPANRGVAACG